MRKVISEERESEREGEGSPLTYQMTPRVGSLLIHVPVYAHVYKRKALSTPSTIDSRPSEGRTKQHIFKIEGKIQSKGQVISRAVESKEIKQKVEIERRGIKN